MNVQPFSPATTTKIAATATSSNTVIDTAGATQVVRVAVTGGNAYIRFTSNASDTATTADMPLFAGAIETFSKGNATRAVVIADTTATVWITTGEGQ
jgi:hypothetical protein